MSYHLVLLDPSKRYVTLFSPLRDGDRMDEFQFVVNHYGDRDMLEGTLSSIAENAPGTPVHVLDGRYANFGTDDDPDLTPGTPDLCSEYSMVEYHSPPEDRLPFGSDGDREAFGRYPVHQKAKWLWYEAVPEDRWSLKIDADERLHKFDLTQGQVDALDETQKHLVELIVGHGEHVQNARLWYPENWTFYVDDICYPRSIVPRDEPFEGLREKCDPNYSWVEIERYEVVGDVSIRNLDHERDEWHTSRREKVKSEISEFAL